MTGNQAEPRSSVTQIQSITEKVTKEHRQKAAKHLAKSASVYQEATVDAFGMEPEKQGTTWLADADDLDSLRSKSMIGRHVVVGACRSLYHAAVRLCSSNLNSWHGQFSDLYRRHDH